MHITELKLSAYRVFAGQEHAHLSRGINAIVGPDGGGKSSLLEAVLWAVGNPDFTQLGDEIIFEGTEDKPQASAGLVELSIDSGISTLDKIQVRRVAFRDADHGVHVINQQIAEVFPAYPQLLESVIHITHPEQCHAMVGAGASDKIFIVDDVDYSLADDDLKAFASALEVLGRRNQVIIASHSKTVVSTAANLIGISPCAHKISTLVTLGNNG